MSSDRLSQLEELLSNYREILYGQESAYVLAPDEDKVRLRLKISKTKTEMLAFEEEYWSILSKQSDSMEIPEQEAEIAIAEIMTGTNEIELESSSYSPEMLIILREIRDKLNQPGNSASAKLKGIISSFPPFVGISYEAELDTEKFLVRYFPTFIRLIKGGAKKKRLT